MNCYLTTLDENLFREWSRPLPAVQAILESGLRCPALLSISSTPLIKLPEVSFLYFNIHITNHIFVQKPTENCTFAWNLCCNPMTLKWDCFGIKIASYVLFHFFPFCQKTSFAWHLYLRRSDGKLFKESSGSAH
jgi:hypothetical protein